MSRRFAAAIPFCRDPAGTLELLLVTSRRKRRWVIPKGTVRGMLPHAAAAREAFEEAGVLGVIGRRQFGVYRQRKTDVSGKKLDIEVEAFPLLVNTQLPSWPEMAMRERQWLGIEDAVALIRDPELRNLLKAFALNYADQGPLD